MAMGIVICMAIAESVHIHSVLTMSNQTACVYKMAIKRNNAETIDAPTMPSGMGFASIMVQSAIEPSLSVESHCFRQGSADFTSDAC
jgi:hypothetical protein